MRTISTGGAGRIEALDMLRGFALLGIFMANMLHFNSPIMYMDPYSWFEGSGESVPYMWLDILVEASFYPIFAMLFGYGLNMQYEKSKLLRQPFGPVAARRMAILLVFGVLHAVFVWSGDVLFTYAMMGFLMIAAVRLPPKWLLALALVLYIVPMGVLTGLVFAGEQLSPDSSLSEFADIQKVDESIKVYGHGDYLTALAFRTKEWLLFTATNFLVNPFMILPLMMIGAALAKWKTAERAHEWRRRIAVIGVVSYIAGIALKSVPFTVGSSLSMQMIQTYFGGPLVAAGYVSFILLLCTVPKFISLFRPVAKAGRMSLTVYLTQSIIATLIFYHYGLGMYGKLDIGTATLLAAGIFVVQALLADLWLSRYRMGPFEWVWRIGTYGTFLPIKKEKQQDMS
ncbi:hypothetical protein NCCP2716_00560 [Sporosarcina sp. NCCP-2716]|uniref:DUF418 domain-containing protein n=1 Tax=Sporosarcina sp. NCCP-2716 TaxID=2943679 RepID=UPI00203B8A9E|nr:DUF418 domain-containing protein [Sporosarcina sp. NCCP-2716]GKV67558.1 hypothetical protein NCCP2716_00560 [Sporosarcina sp. NCCP-2716]